MSGLLISGNKTPYHFSTTAEIRAIPTEFLERGEPCLYTGTESGDGNEILYLWNPDEGGTDTGGSDSAILRPDDIGSEDPGRWFMANAFKQSGSGAVPRTMLAKTRETVSVTDFGAKGDGATDDSAAIGLFIAACNGKGGVWPAGTYLANSAIEATFTGSQKWESDGPVIIKWNSASAGGVMMTLTTTGYGFSMSGDFTFDGNDLARSGLRVQNNSAATSADVVKLQGVKAKNCYSSLIGTGSYGLLVSGGCSYARLEDCGAFDISRAAGVGVPGSQGSFGIGVISASATAYPERVEILEPTVERVTSEEVDGDANNVDCDGIVITGQTPSAATEQPRGWASVKGGRFVDNKGRHIKTQVGHADVSGGQFIREGIKTIANGHDISFQYGFGSVRGCEFWYGDLSGAAVFGSSFSTIDASSLETTPAVSGSVSISDCQIVNNQNISIADLPYFFSITTPGSSVFKSVSIKDVRHMGTGRITRLVYGSGSVARLSVKDCYLSRLSSSFIEFNSGAPQNMQAHISGNFSDEPTARPLVTATSLPEISGDGNMGFTETFSGLLSGTTQGQGAIRANAILPTGSKTTGAFSIESATIADAGTHTFSQRNYSSGTGIYFLTANFTRFAQAIFVHDGTVLDLTGGAATSVALGSASDPGTPSALNVWMDVNKCINVTNRLGSSRVVTLASIG